MKKIVLRHRSYVKIKQPPVSSSSRRVECENFFPAHCDLFIIHAANDLGLSLYCIQNLGYTRQRPNMVGMRSLASCSASFCNCLRCQVQLQRLSLLLLLPTHCHRDGGRGSSTGHSKAQLWLCCLTQRAAVDASGPLLLLPLSSVGLWMKMNESLMGFGFGARARLPERVCAGNSVEFLSLARSVGGSCSLSTSCARALALSPCLSLCVCLPHATVV